MPDYYKVVAVWDGKLMSAHITGIALLYQPGISTKPSISGSRLCVFGDLSNAREWREVVCEGYRSQIWSCDAVNAKPLDVLLRLPNAASYEQLYQFWEDYSGQTMLAPPGTCVAEEVTLLERIE